MDEQVKLDISRALAAYYTEVEKLEDDRRELLETSKKVAKWLEYYTEIWFSSEDDIESESFRDVSGAWYKCIERLSS